MAKTRKPRKRKKRAARSGPVYVALENPFAQIEEENMGMVRADIAEYHEKQFQEGIKRLEEIAGTEDAIYLLVYLSLSNLFTGISDAGELSHSWHSPRVSQAGIELFQALILKNFGNNNNKAPLEIHTKEVDDLLPKVIQSFSLKSIPRLLGDEETKHIMFLQHRLRIHTLGIRNWGYYEQSLGILKELYSPLDDDFRQEGLLGQTGTVTGYSSMGTDGHAGRR